MNLKRPERSTRLPPGNPDGYHWITELFKQEPELKQATTNDQAHRCQRKLSGAWGGGNFGRDCRPGESLQSVLDAIRHGDCGESPWTRKSCEAGTRRDGALTDAKQLDKEESHEQ